MIYLYLSFWFGVEIFHDSDLFCGIFELNLMLSHLGVKLSTAVISSSEAEAFTPPVWNYPQLWFIMLRLRIECDAFTLRIWIFPRLWYILLTFLIDPGAFTYSARDSPQLWFILLKFRIEPESFTTLMWTFSHLQIEPHLGCENSHTIVIFFVEAAN